MRWPLIGRWLHRPDLGARVAIELAEQDSTRRLAEAEQFAAEARAVAEDHREIRRRNNFGPMILGEIGRRHP